MTIEGPSRIIKDKEEAQAVADAGKPFRDQATEAKGRVGADREVLERVADDVENKAGKEYRELKELLPTEVIDKLSKDLAGELGGNPDGQKMAARFPRFFAELVGELNRALKDPTKKITKERIRSLKPYSIRELNLSNKYFDVEAWQNALYQVLGVGKSSQDVFETFRALTDEQKKEVATLIGEKEVGNADETPDTTAYVTIPTNIDGILLSVMYHSTYKGTPAVSLKFTPEFLERAMK